MAQAYEAPRRRNGAAGALRSRATDVLEDIAELQKDVGKLANAASKAAREEVDLTRDRIDYFGKSLRGRADDSVRYVGDHVRERPAAAIGIALGTGLLIGLAMKLKR